MKMIKTGILLAGAASLLTLGACNPEPAAKPAASASAPAAAALAKEPAEATVNGVAISKNRVDLVARQGNNAGQAGNPDFRKTVVDQLALQMLVAEAAIKKGLDKSAEVTEQIELMRQSILANAYVQDFIKTSAVTDEMLKAEYERIKATISGTEYKARHILVEKEADAKALIARLKKEPAAFEKLAKEKSRDTGSGAQGGELGWFDLSRMVPEFGAAVSKMEKGKISDEPVKTQYGYHVIQLEDSKPIEAPPFDEVKPNLAQQLAQQNLKKELDDIKSKAKIEMVGAAAPATPVTAAAPAAK
jgi:peptidyl-prolyl cis-trans isomerase C